MALLEIHDLETVFALEHMRAAAVRGVSLSVDAGETVGLVGESGSGKSITALSVMRLLPPNGRIVGGAIRFAGTDLLSLSQKQMRDIRGKRIGMVFQDSMSSLNPVLTVGRQITESIEAHSSVTHRAALARARELLEEVGVPEPDRRLGQFPHQLSGGLRQRVAVAVALAPGPQVLIADEPTTALDVTIQAQLLDLLAHEQRRRNMGLILITHDLGVVARMADRIAVMYAGRIVEHGTAEHVFHGPRHPYTLGLLRAVPRISGPVADRLSSIPGAPPLISEPTPGCRFRPRCAFSIARCADEDPPLELVESGHAVACWADVTTEV